MHLLERLDGSGVRGKVESTQNIKGAIVEVTGSNGQKIQDYRVNPNGVFHIVLNSGDYNLTLKNNNEVLSTKPITINDTRVHINL